MSNLISATVVICALNEEKNLAQILQDLLRQSNKKFQLDKILVVSDGSTDNTNKIARSFASYGIKLKSYKERMGKVFRLSQIFKELKSEVVVILDADTHLKNNFVLENMILPFTKDEKLGMVGGNHQPKDLETFIQKAINSSFFAYNILRDKYPALSFGPIVAYRKSLAKKISFPENIYGEDAFGYLSCKSLGFNYFYSKMAKVHFNFPKTLADHIKQNQRFVSVPTKMENYFSKDLVAAESYISKKDLFSSHVQSLIKYPVHSLSIFLINQYCKLLGRLNKDKMNGKWEISKSTK